MERFGVFSKDHRSGFVRKLPVDLLAGTLLISSVCFASSVPVSSQPDVTALLLKISLAFSSAGKQPTALTLNGTVDFTAGSAHESGTLQLKSSLDGSTSETWTLSTQSHSLTQGPLKGSRVCSYTDPGSKSHDAKDLNCLRVVPWFAPWLASGLVTPALTIATDMTKTTDSDAGLQRLFFAPNVILSPDSAVPFDVTVLPQMAGVSITYGALTALPSAMEYSQIVDSEPSHSLAIRVVYSDYRLESGYFIPHHLQRFVQRTLQADIQITSVTAE